MWLRIGKKGSAVQSVSYPEALEAALCYGWIDGQKRPENDETWLQRFLPRSSRSIWSKINRDKAMSLVETGRMKPAGFEAIEQAKASGCWQRAYDPPSRATVPEDFEAALKSSPKAGAFFAAIDGANRYAILFVNQNAHTTLDGLFSPRPPRVQRSSRVSRAPDPRPMRAGHSWRILALSPQAPAQVCPSGFTSCAQAARERYIDVVTCAKSGW